MRKIDFINKPAAVQDSAVQIEVRYVWSYFSTYCANCAPGCCLSQRYIWKESRLTSFNWFNNLNILKYFFYYSQIQFINLFSNKFKIFNLNCSNAPVLKYDIVRQDGLSSKLEVQCHRSKGSTQNAHSEAVFSVAISINRDEIDESCGHLEDTTISMLGQFKIRKSLQTYWICVIHVHRCCGSFGNGPLEAQHVASRTNSEKVRQIWCVGARIWNKCINFAEIAHQNNGNKQYSRRECEIFCHF